MLIPKPLLQKLANEVLPKHIQKAVELNTRHLNSAGFDRWGLDPQYLKAAIALFWPLYKYYFRVKAHGLDKIPKDRVMLIANHSGQIPLDAILISLAILDQAQNPRLCRAMVEQWVPTLPFVSDLFTRCGQTIGDPHNCIDLLNHEQCLLVFPEGTKGLGKTYSKAYQLQKFGNGFCRLGIEQGTAFIPVSVIGAEEIYPSIGQWKAMAKILKAPYFPITPLFPFFGPLGALPMPSSVDIYFGESIKWKKNTKLNDAQIKTRSKKIKDKLQKLIDTGLQKREGLFNQRRMT